MKCNFIYPYPLNASGSGIFVQNLAKGLTDIGWEVHLLTVEFAPYYPQTNGVFWEGLIVGDSFPLSRIPIYTGIGAPCIPFGELSNDEYKSYQTALKKQWQRVLNPRSKDIVIVSHLWTHAAMLKDIGVAVDGIIVHGTDLFAWHKYPSYRQEILESANWAKRPVVLSRAVKEKVLSLKLFDSELITLIPPAIKKEIFCWRNSSSPSIEPLVLHIPGKFVHFKGTDRLLKAIPLYEKMIPSVRTEIWGVDMLSSSTPIYFKNNKFRNTEIYNEWIDQFSLANKIRSARVLVVPSREEPFGIIAAEALALGTAVVGDKSGGLLDIVGPGDGVLVDAENPKMLADAIANQVARPNTKNDRQQRSQRALNRFGTDAVLRQWITWFEQLQDLKILSNQ